MKTILPFDELNAFRSGLARHFENGCIRSRKDCEDIIDELLDLYLLAIANAVDAINSEFGTDVQLSAADIERIVYIRFDGAMWEDRVWSWYEAGGTMDDIMRIAETELHRDGNTAAYEAALAAGATKKTWETMMDDRVRDTHMYLETVTIGIRDEFYTYDGDHALAPGMFELPENNINCRCELSYS